MVAPILEFLGLSDPPHLIKGGKHITIAIDDRDQILEGLIDSLVMQNRMWLVLLETKRYGFSVMKVLPQALSYITANLGNDDISYGLITTGEDFLFVKLNLQTREYDTSDKFTLSTQRDNQLHTVIQILKQMTDLNDTLR